jgi:hypothetical protein
MPKSMLSTARFARQALGRLAWAPMLRKPRPTPVVENWIAGDSHTHSDVSDGLVPLEEQVAWAAENGHGWIGIVDHGDGVEGDLTAFLERCDAAARQHEITVVPGIEITALSNPASARDTGDLVIFGARPKSSLPPNQGLDELSLLRNAHADRTRPLRVIAHPSLRFKRWSCWNPHLIEGIELATGTHRPLANTLARWFDTGRRALFSGGRWPVGVAGSDGHAPWQTPGLGGMTWVRAARGSSPEEIRAALLGGQAVISTRGDFACFEADGSTSGDTITNPGGASVTLTVRPAERRKCTGVTIYNEHARMLAYHSNPKDGDVVRFDTTTARVLIGHFEFCKAGSCRGLGDVFTNPMMLWTPEVRGSRVSAPQVA